MAASTSSRIVVDAPRAEVMAVIADFATYPQWASAVRAAETLGQDADGRASRVRFRLDAGVVKDTYVLGYDWDGDAGVRWHLAEAGSVISGMSGGMPSPNALARPRLRMTLRWICVSRCRDCS